MHNKSKSNLGKCSRETDTLCSSKTRNMGLCLPNYKMCSRANFTRTSDMIPIPLQEDTIGRTFSYTESNLHENCGTLEIEYQKTYPENAEVVAKTPSLKICTWNIWGILKYKQPFMGKSLHTRIMRIIDIIYEHDIDIICLQEVSIPVYKMLSRSDKIRQRGYHFYDETIQTPEMVKQREHNGLEVLFLTKQPVFKYTNYKLGGNLGYKNSLSVIEYKDLIVYGCYFQAGSIHSPGQQYKWIHYSRCRSEQLRVLRNLIMRRRLFRGGQVVLGDMNFHLDSNQTEFPEIREFEKLKDIGFIDSYRSLFPDIGAFPGYTEDTTINHMRWNSKFMEKHFRYDGIVTRNMTPIDNSILLGMDPINLTDEEIALMISHFVYKNDERVRKTNDRLALFPSDHFGIMTVFV